MVTRVSSGEAGGGGGGGVSTAPLLVRQAYLTTNVAPTNPVDLTSAVWNITDIGTGITDNGTNEIYLPAGRWLLRGDLIQEVGDDWLAISWRVNGTVIRPYGNDAAATSASPFSHVQAVHVFESTTPSTVEVLLQDGTTLLRGTVSNNYAASSYSIQQLPSTVGVQFDGLSQIGNFVFNNFPEMNAAATAGTIFSDKPIGATIYLRDSKATFITAIDFTPMPSQVIEQIQAGSVSSEAELTVLTEMPDGTIVLLNGGRYKYNASSTAGILPDDTGTNPGSWLPVKHSMWLARGTLINGVGLNAGSPFSFVADSARLPLNSPSVFLSRGENPITQNGTYELLINSTQVYDIKVEFSFSPFQTVENVPAQVRHIPAVGAQSVIAVYNQESESQSPNSYHTAVMVGTALLREGDKIDIRCWEDTGSPGSFTFSIRHLSISISQAD